MRKKKVNEKQSSIPVYVILIAVVAVMLILTADIIVVRSIVKKTADTHLSEQARTIAGSAQNNLDRMRSKVDVVEEVVGGITSKEELKKELQQVKETSAIYDFYYLTTDGDIYDDRGNLNPGDVDFSGIAEIRNNRFRDNYFCCVENIGVEKEMVRVVAVYREYTKDENLKGYLIVTIELHKVFNESNYSLYEDVRSICLTDEDGVIFDSSDDFKKRFGEGKSAFSLLFDQTDQSSSSRNKINRMRRYLSVDKEYEISCKTANGKNFLIRGTKIEGIDDLYVIVAYEEGMMENILLPAMLASFISVISVVLVLFFIIILQMMVNYRNNARMEELAYIDDVTGGTNINYFKLKVPNLIFDNTERNYIIVRFDIANFRYINEAYGRKSADGILKAISKTFEEVYSKNELCSRINSDQFIALVVNDFELPDKRGRFEKEISDTVKGLGVKYPIRFKKGIYQVRKEDRNIETMMDHANAARKSLKGDEKILEVTYSENIISEMKKNDEIVSSMQNALTHGEFRPYLQPKFDIFENKIVGAEILVRWIKEDGTMVYPSDFIPIFERNGFIEKLDFYMLERLCEEIKRYKDSGEYKIVPVSINQSRILLNNPEYLKNVERIMNRYETSIEDIQIEITESVFFNDRDKMISVIDQLKEMGLMLCMDDFGSGYSSLNLLKDVPFDILKIDKDFFSEVDTSRDTMIIMQRIVEMATDLGIKVVCEGVETQGQIDMLKKIGCRMVQGFYYSKPIPLAAFMDKYLKKEDTAKADGEKDEQQSDADKSIRPDGEDDKGSADKGKAPVTA